MTPTRQMEKLLGGIISRYAFFLRIEIYAYCFLSNHYHLIIKAPLGNADEFCENVNREIARRVNKLNGRIGAFWHRRYDDQKILSSEDLLEGFLYVLTNPVRHGLVEHTSQWTGLSGYRHALDGQDREFTFRLKSKKRGETCEISHLLKLSVLPCFQDLTPKKRRGEIVRLINERCSAIRGERRRQGLGFLGSGAVLSQPPGGTPKSVSRSNRPIGYTKDDQLRREYRDQEKERRNRYVLSSRQYRLGDVSANFPEYTYRPPLHRVPRRSPFGPYEAPNARVAA
jgi:REP element-mobilizing transposase RayT